MDTTMQLEPRAILHQSHNTQPFRGKVVYSDAPTLRTMYLLLPANGISSTVTIASISLCHPQYGLKSDCSTS